MKFGIIGYEIINLQAQSGHLKVYEQLHLSERGKQRTPLQRLPSGGCYKSAIGRKAFIFVRVGAQYRRSYGNIMEG